MTARRIIRTYLGSAASTTLAQSLIWGVSTLFLLSVGLDIFQVMLVNAAYTVAQVVFEVPTGVIADTLGRRVSCLLPVSIIFFVYGFYSWQKSFLDLLGQDLVWVTGVIAALVGLTQILGNALVGRITKRVADRGLILMVAVSVSTAALVGAALVQQFWVAVPPYLVSTTASGVYVPVKQGRLNARISSEERATIISLDALFGDGGMTVGQVGLGYVSQVVSIPAGWLAGGLTQAAALPLLARARRAERAEPAEPAAWPDSEVPGESAGQERAA